MALFNPCNLRVSAGATMVLTAISDSDENDRSHLAGEDFIFDEKTESSSEILSGLGSQGIVTLGINLRHVRLAVSQHHLGSVLASVAIKGRSATLREEISDVTSPFLT